MVTQNRKTSGGVPCRIGRMLHDEINKIKGAKLTNGTAKSSYNLSMEKITNLIVKHKMWAQIASHIIEANEEEVNRYGT